ncbi:hypothetical protein DENSPDRAFT_839158 [Dentipellis sp. KUC8613]|nr:hypothetical protein DENSPDRAFT_839158 [Dentipellis sp. KUC8613]
MTKSLYLRMYFLSVPCTHSPLSSQSISRFHSASVPHINVLDYLRRIVRFTNVEVRPPARPHPLPTHPPQKTCLLIVMHYIDQICVRIPTFTLSSLTCHRFVITAVALASKTLCDAFCTNAHYARIGGITPHELARLEREFLFAIDWRAQCTRDVLQLYYENLITHSGGRFVLQQPSDTASTSSDGDDLDFVTSRSASPSGSTTLGRDSPAPAPPAPTAPGPGPTRVPSMILSDTTTLTPGEVPSGPTVEQNMAFEQFQRSLQRES